MRVRITPSGWRGSGRSNGGCLWPPSNARLVRSPEYRLGPSGGTSGLSTKTVHKGHPVVHSAGGTSGDPGAPRRPAHDRRGDPRPAVVRRGPRPDDRERGLPLGPPRSRRGVAAAGTVRDRPRGRRGRHGAGPGRRPGGDRAAPRGRRRVELDRPVRPVPPLSRRAGLAVRRQRRGPPPDGRWHDPPPRERTAAISSRTADSARWPKRRSSPRARPCRCPTASTRRSPPSSAAASRPASGPCSRRRPCRPARRRP